MSKPDTVLPKGAQVEKLVTMHTRQPATIDSLDPMISEIYIDYIPGQCAEVPVVVIVDSVSGKKTVTPIGPDHIVMLAAEEEPDADSTVNH